MEKANVCCAPSAGGWQFPILEGIHTHGLELAGAVCAAVVSSKILIFALSPLGDSVLQSICNLLSAESFCRGGDFHLRVEVGFPYQVASEMTTGVYGIRPSYR